MKSESKKDELSPNTEKQPNKKIIKRSNQIVPSTSSGDISAVGSNLSLRRVSNVSFGSIGEDRKAEWSKAISVSKDLPEFEPGSAISNIEPTSTLEISISARGLLNKDLLSKSDPICIVYNKATQYTKNWQEITRTEVIKDTLNPDFIEKLTVDYHFEEIQRFKFEFFDIDNDPSNLKSQDFLGFCSCTLAQIVAAGLNGYRLPLSLDKDAPYREGEVPEKACGSIILTAEELPSLKDEVLLKFSVTNLLQIQEIICCCPFLRSKVYFIIYKRNSIPVYRSKPSSNYNWPPLQLGLQRLCNGNKDLQLKIEFFHVNYSLGFCNTTLDQIINTFSNGKNQLPMLDSKTGKPKSSRLIIKQMEIKPVYTFFDYVQAGCEIHSVISIDFTSSNGHPKKKCSLHYIGEETENPYEQAIQAVGSILQEYDTDKNFPCYGFGAKIPPDREISHLFNVNLKTKTPCEEIEGVLNSYRRCLKQIELYGPTNVAPTINEIIKMAKESYDDSSKDYHYFVLLIISDGIFTDIEQTKEAIVEASRHPISIIIIGVGDEDFTEMEELDGDEVRISYKDEQAERDIVQFIPYRNNIHWIAECIGAEYLQQLMSKNGINTLEELSTRKNRSINFKLHQLAQSKLASEVLSEIPEQIAGYMRSKNIIPIMEYNFNNNNNNNNNNYTINE